MAVRFSAANQAVTGTGPTGNTATVLGWLYIVNDRNDFSNVLVMHNGSEGTPEAGIGTSADGTTMTGYDAAFTSTGSIATSVATWYRYALVMNNTAWTFYLGAAGAAVTSASGTRTAISSPSTIVFSSTGDWMDCRQAAVKVYLAALSADELEEEWGQYQPVRTANLQRYHPFVNAELVDYSGGGNTLTAGAGATTTEAGPPIRWDSRTLEQFFVPEASNVANPAAAEATIGMAAQNATIRISTSAGSASFTAAAQDASTSIRPRAGEALILLAEDNPTTTVRVNPTTAGITFSAQDANASTAATNASAQTAAFTMSAQNAEAPTVAGHALITWSGQNAMVIGGTNVNPNAATLGMAANNASIRILVNAGFAAVGIDAGDVIVGNLLLACANLSATVTPDQHFAVVDYADRHSSTVTVDEHTTAIGVEEHYAETSICGRG